DKQALRIGGENAGNQFRQTENERPRVMGNPDAGIVLVSAENGAVRSSPKGVYVYDDDGTHEVDLSVNNKGVGSRQGELVEFHRAIQEGKAPFHDGLWGMATLEVALAIMESAKERKEIMLSHQVPVPADYDKELIVPYIENE